jgi:hypothetical protein
MKFKVSTNKDAIQETGTSSYIATSGIYDVKILFASIDTTASGAESVNFNLEYNGNPQTIYGPYVTQKNGDVNEIGAKTINKLAIIAGMTDGDDFEIEEETHNVGKDNKPTDFAVITNFTDLPIKIRLQEEYSINPNTKAITKRMVIKNFFSESGASAEELVNNTEAGVRLALEQEKYASHITYKDGLTEEQVTLWKESKKSDSKSTPTPKAKPVVDRKGSIFK